MYHEKFNFCFDSSFNDDSNRILNQATALPGFKDSVADRIKKVKRTVRDIKKQPEIKSERIAEEIH